MPWTSRARDGWSHPLWAVSLLAVLTTGTLLLSVAAIAHGQPDPPRSTPVSTVRDETVTPTPTSSTSPLALPPLTRGQERFLLVDDVGTLWRAVAGSCVTGEAAIVERSVDGGASWSDVTPRYQGLNQVAGLRPLISGEAQLIASVDASCGAQGFRTYTQGVFWEPFIEVMTGASYLPPAVPAALVTPFGAPPAPCVEPTSLSAGDDAAALLCGSQPYLWSPALGTTWRAVAAGPARAVLVTGDTLTVARASVACEGMTLSTLAVADPTDFTSTCLPDLDMTDAAALAADPSGGLVLWAGDALTRP